MATGCKYPPEGVETKPTSDDIVWLRDAARALGRDHRTVRDKIILGQIRGGAIPNTHRLRWYVYADELPARSAPPDTDVRVPGASAPLAEQLRAAQDVIDNQATQIVTLEHNNRVLTAAVQDLLDGLDHYKAGARSALDAAQHFEAAADKFAASVQGHRDALAHNLTPGNLSALGDITDRA